MLKNYIIYICNFVLSNTNIMFIFLGTTHVFNHFLVIFLVFQ